MNPRLPTRDNLGGTGTKNRDIDLDGVLVIRSLWRDRIVTRRLGAFLLLAWALLLLPDYLRLFGGLLGDSGVALAFRLSILCLAPLPIPLILLAPWIVSRILHR